MKSVKYIVTVLLLSLSIASYAGDNIREVTQEQFNEEVKEGIVLVDFWATWCMPCRMQGRELKVLAFEARDFLKIIKVDVDKNPALAQRFFVSSIPTMLIFKNGHLEKRMVGYVAKDELLGILNQLKEK